MGLTRPMTRIGWHLRAREIKIAELNTVIKPKLILEPNLILTSNDRAALDVEGMKIIKGFLDNSLKKDPLSYPQIRRAVELEIGSKSEKDYKVK
jgi:hypothetical protein